MDPVKLHAWIAASKHTQRVVVAVSLAVLVVGIALKVVQVIPALVSTVIILAALITGVAGFWVTAAHIADWRAKLARHR